MQRQRRRNAGQPVHLGRVGKLLFDGGSGGGLRKLAETRAGVGEAPGGNLDLESIQRLKSLRRILRIQKASSFISSCRTGYLRLQFRFWFRAQVVHQNHVQKSRPMHAL